MGMWTKGPDGRSQWRDDLADTPENQANFGEGRGTWDGSQTQQGSAGGGGNSNSQMQQNAANTGGNTSSAAPVGGADPGTNYNPSWGDPRFGGNTTEADRVRSIYDWGEQESFGQYGQRAFEQALGEFGPAYLNPNSLENPLADSPYAQWFRNYYGEDMPANALMAMVLGNNQDGFAPGMQSGIQAGLNNRASGGFAGAQGNLANLSNVINQIASGNMNGLSTFQREAGSEIMNSPSLAIQMIMGQLHNTLGSRIGARTARRLQSSANDYFGDPVTNNPATAGPWLTNALKRLGVIS